MNPEFKKYLDEIRDYVEGVSPEGRAALMQALVQRLLAEYSPGHLPDSHDIFRETAKPGAPTRNAEAAHA